VSGACPNPAVKRQLGWAVAAAVLAGHKTFDRPSLAVYGQWSEMVLLVSDASPEGEFLEAIRNSGARLLVAGDEVRPRPGATSD
jgi:DeoR/GlpR family transcriptional regulator of sugar metabolism